MIVIIKLFLQCNLDIYIHIQKSEIILHKKITFNDSASDVILSFVS